VVSSPAAFGTSSWKADNACPRQTHQIFASADRAIFCHSLLDAISVSFASGARKFKGSGQATTRDLARLMAKIELIAAPPAIPTIMFNTKSISAALMSTVAKDHFATALASQITSRMPIAESNDSLNNTNATTGIPVSRIPLVFPTKTRRATQAKTFQISKPSQRLSLRDEPKKSAGVSP
jgi:hypothetical protein